MKDSINICSSLNHWTLLDIWPDLSFLTDFIVSTSLDSWTIYYLWLSYFWIVWLSLATYTCLNPSKFQVLAGDYPSIQGLLNVIPITWNKIYLPQLFLNTKKNKCKISKSKMSSSNQDCNTYMQSRDSVTIIATPFFRVILKRKGNN